MKIDRKQLNEIIHEIITQDAEDTDAVISNAVNYIVKLLYNDQKGKKDLAKKILLIANKDTKIELI